MLKHLKYSIAIIALLTLCQPALAFDTKSIVKIDAPYATLYRGSFDNLVLDFSILATNSDTLKAVSLKNLGTANINQISYLTLWADSGPIGFQGMGVDRNLGNLAYISLASAKTGNLQNWYKDNLNERITDSQRFFVTAEFFTYVSQPASIQMQIPQLVDNNKNGSYDLTDLGIFMDSGNNGPTDFAVTNPNTQVISAVSADSWQPKISLTNLTANQILNNTNYLIQGIARDQGNSGVLDLKIFIDGQENVITAYNDATYAWEYDWQNITDGSHTIKVLGRDSLYNSSQSEEITVTVSNQPLSLTSSSVTIDRPIIRNDGLDKALVTVKLKDVNSQAIANRQVSLESPDVIALTNKLTDSIGQAVFEVRSTVIGPKILVVKTDGQVLAALNLTVNLSGADVNSGDLIKGSTPAVYYFGANGKRYVFPTADIYFSWYSDFKNIKTIANNQLAALPIGGNVTYKPGTKLIKLTTDPKVYAVDLGDTLRWIKTEAVARSLYGSAWVSKIVDVSDAYFLDYKRGAEIGTAGAFDLAVAKAVSGINEDKGL